MRFHVKQLTASDTELMVGMLDLFGAAFEQEEVYGGKRPSDSYLSRILAGPSFIALAALEDGKVVGGLAAYELPKFEQERSEIYIYDLAVAAIRRRHGIATALIRQVGVIAARRDAHVIFVQADSGDHPAIALYSKLGRREEVLHFDLDVPEMPAPPNADKG